MSNILQKIKLGKDNVKLIDFPGTTEKVAMKILSVSEIQLATFNTEHLFVQNKIEIHTHNGNEYDAEKAVQILFLSLRNPTDLEEPICPNITEFRKSLTKDEREALVDLYLTFEKDVSPSPETLSDDEFDQLVSQIKKNAEKVLMNNLSTNTLKKLIITLAKQPTNLPQHNGG